MRARRLGRSRIAVGDPEERVDRRERRDDEESPTPGARAHVVP